MGYKSPHMYTLTGSAGSSDPTDATTYYWGGFMGVGMGTVADIQRMYVPKTGRVVAVTIATNAFGVAGTNENISQSLRKNSTTDYLIQTVGLANAQRNFINYALNIPVVAGDYFVFKWESPTWVTNPTQVYMHGTILIECE